MFPFVYLPTFSFVIRVFVATGPRSDIHSHNINVERPFDSFFHNLTLLFHIVVIHSSRILRQIMRCESNPQEPDTVDYRSSGSAYNKDFTLTTFLYIPMGYFSLFLYNGYNNISLQQQISADPLKKKRNLTVT